MKAFHPGWGRAGLFAALVLAFVLPSPARASSHREAPLISKDPTLDNTDVYAFRDPIVTDQLTIIANWIPFEEPAGFPNYNHFAENAWYQIHIDQDGDGIEDITYRFTFHENVVNPNTFLEFTGPVASLTDPHINVFYTYDVDKIIGPSADPPPSMVTHIGSGLIETPNNTGPKTYPNDYGHSGLQAGIYTLDGNVRVYAGPRSDMFFVDLGMIGDLINFRPGTLPGNMRGGINTIAGFNIHTITMQIPIVDVTKNGQFPTSISDPNAIIGVWSTTWVPQNRTLSTTGAKPSEAGPYVQVSRLGLPLINEVVIPRGSKDLFNASYPKDDAQFAAFVLDPEVPKILNALFGITVPPAPRNDLVPLVTGLSGLTRRPNEVIADELRLNLAVYPTPIAPVNMTSRMGLLGGDMAGFPNGRRPWDDVVDIELQVLAGVLIPAFNIAPNNELGDGVDGPARPFLEAFPYLPRPYEGYDHKHDNPEQFLLPATYP